MTEDQRRVIGFIGLGHMGTPMSGRLVAAGHQVRGFDLSPAARDRLREQGGHPVATAAGAARGAAAVVLMLPGSGAVEQVVTDPAFVAALTAGPDGQRPVVADMSSSEPARTRELARRLAGHGVALVDAPVSGGVPRARSGQLTVMVGGDDAPVARVQPVLDELGTVHRAGPVGAGHAVKALNNLMSAVHLLITSEAILAGQEFGLEPEAMLAIFNSSSGKSGSTENKWPNYIVPETFDSGFGLRLMVKDMRIALGLAAQVQRPSPLGELALTRWAQAAEALPADADHTEIARWLRTADHGAGAGPPVS